MKVEIESQAKSEVGELLQAYVVAPLNADLISALQETKDKFDQETEKTANNLSKKVTSQIGRLETKLNNQFQKIQEYLESEELPNTIADSQEAICNRLSDLSSKVQSALASLDQRIAAAEQSEGQNLSELNTQQDFLRQQTQAGFAQLAQTMEGEFTALKTAGKDCRTALTQGLNNFSAALEQERTALLARLDAFESAMANVRGSNQAELKKLFADSRAESEQHWSSLAAHQAVLKAELEQYHILIEKKYKTLLTASLALGITNFFLLCALLLTHFQ